MARSVMSGAMVPGADTRRAPLFLGEVIATFTMVAGLCVPRVRKSRRFTAAMFPFLYAVMVRVEAPIWVSANGLMP